MNDWKHSLRKTVEYWLSPCFVKVMTSEGGGVAEMYFFRHGDGTWRVFPPNHALPTLTYPKFA
jgi:hypothetical protein